MAKIGPRGLDFGKVNFFLFFSFLAPLNWWKMGLNFEKVPKFGLIGHKILWKIRKNWFWGNSRTSGFSLFPPVCPVCSGHKKMVKIPKNSSKFSYLLSGIYKVIKIIFLGKNIKSQKQSIQKTVSLIKIHQGSVTITFKIFRPHEPVQSGFEFISTKSID